MRMWNAEYSTEELEREQALGYFLVTTIRLTPEFTQHLQDDVLPIFENYKGSSNYFGTALARSANTPESRKLMETLETWAQQFHLGKDNFESSLKGYRWMSDLALEALWFWSENKPDGRWPLETTFYTPYSAKAPPPQLTPWQPDWQYWNEYQASVLQQLKDYRNEVEAEIERASDWQKSTVKPRLLQHLEWLVRYQVQGWTQTQIQDKYPKTEGTSECDRVDYDVSNISRSINAVAHEVGISLRTPGVGGRPKNP